MTELNPIIQEICKQYQFEIEYVDILKRWCIRKETRHCCFYWSDDMPYERFFSELRNFFEDVGSQNEYWN
jgi:hypothetical protein